MTYSAASLPAASLVARDQNGRVFYEAKFRYNGEQVWRRVGPAWLEADPNASTGCARHERFRSRRGRVAPGYFDERSAHVRAAEIVKKYVDEVEYAERIREERRIAGATFREVAHAYLDWLEKIKRAAPSTLQQHRYDLAEPGLRYRRGKGFTSGHVMAALGDKPASKITTEDVEELLANIGAGGVSARTVNRYRDVVSAAFNFGMRSTKFKLKQNPARGTDSRAIPAARVLVFYTPEEIEAVAHAFEDGLHRQVNERHARSCQGRHGGRCDCTPTYRAGGHEFETLEQARKHHRQTRSAGELAADQRDACAVRLAAYAGLRLGELLALRVGDIDWTGSVLTISRAISVGVEKGTKSGRIRQIPLAEHAALALARVLDRDDFRALDDFVFCDAFGHRLDGSALRRRYKLARDAAGLRPLRWHDLRHTFGSLLVAGGIDLVSVKDAMGHAQLSTTTRYLHARPATERAASFTAAFDRMGTTGAARPALDYGQRSLSSASDRTLPIRASRAS
ncbi:MAG: tyrosine-type recombinase/integrase [Actinomycetota bacterium]|nr:tyrosine-type recombinase/integrase [Actinomycetota bacterium]